VVLIRDLQAHDILESRACVVQDMMEEVHRIDRLLRDVVRRDGLAESVSGDLTAGIHDGTDAPALR